MNIILREVRSRRCCSKNFFSAVKSVVAMLVSLLLGFDLKPQFFLFWFNLKTISVVGLNYLPHHEKTLTNCLSALCSLLSIRMRVLCDVQPYPPLYSMWSVGKQIRQLLYVWYGQKRILDTPKPQKGKLTLQACHFLLLIIHSGWPGLLMNQDSVYLKSKNWVLVKFGKS